MSWYKEWYEEWDGNNGENGERLMLAVFLNSWVGMGIDDPAPYLFHEDRSILSVTCREKSRVVSLPAEACSCLSGGENVPMRECLRLAGQQGGFTPGTAALMNTGMESRYETAAGELCERGLLELVRLDGYGNLSRLSQAGAEMMTAMGEDFVMRPEGTSECCEALYDIEMRSAPGYPRPDTANDALTICLSLEAVQRIGQLNAEYDFRKAVPYLRRDCFLRIFPNALRTYKVAFAGVVSEDRGAFREFCDIVTHPILQTSALIIMEPSLDLARRIAEWVSRTVSGVVHVLYTAYGETDIFWLRTDKPVDRAALYNICDTWMPDDEIDADNFCFA